MVKTEHITCFCCYMYKTSTRKIDLTQLSTRYLAIRISTESPSHYKPKIFIKDQLLESPPPLKPSQFMTVEMSIFSTIWCAQDQFKGGRVFSRGHGCTESICIAVTEHLLGNCKDSNNYRVDGGPLPLLELSASPLSTMPSTSIGGGG